MGSWSPKINRSPLPKKKKFQPISTPPLTTPPRKSYANYCCTLCVKRCRIEFISGWRLIILIITLYFISLDYSFFFCIHPDKIKNTRSLDNLS